MLESACSRNRHQLHRRFAARYLARAGNAPEITCNDGPQDMVYYRPGWRAQGRFETRNVRKSEKGESTDYSMRVGRPVRSCVHRPMMTSSDLHPRKEI